ARSRPRAHATPAARRPPRPPALLLSPPTAPPPPPPPPRGPGWARGGGAGAQRFEQLRTDQAGRPCERDASGAHIRPSLIWAPGAVAETVSPWAKPTSCPASAVPSARASSATAAATAGAT